MSKSLTVERKEVIKTIEEEVQALQASYDILLDRPPQDEGLDINISYPKSDVWDFDTSLQRINLDEERKKDIISGNGFVISPYQTIKKELKAPYGIFSPKYGQQLSDVNPFIDRYKCECGYQKSRIYNNMECPVCHTKTKYVDDDFGYFGWMVLNNYYLIHPNLYKSIESIIGAQRLINILDIEDEKNEDGHSVNPSEEKPKKRKRGPHIKERGKNEPFYGIGMIEFKKRFVEILDYYVAISTNKASKMEYYNDIMNNLDKVFCQSIPVYTTHLRPYEVSDKTGLKFEATNAIYNMLSKLVTEINDDKLRHNREKKPKMKLLFDTQIKWNELYKEIDNILSGKKGNVRLLAGGKMNFSSRNVITQNPKLRIDQVTLPYWCLVDILQQQIINILVKTYNMSYNDAYYKWYTANIEPDKTIIQIIRGIMYSNDQGLPVIINRNPSISRGSLLQMYCVDMTFNYTMALPLQILPLLAADSTKAIGVTYAGMQKLKLCKLLGRFQYLNSYNVTCKGKRECGRKSEKMIKIGICGNTKYYLQEVISSEVS